MLLVANLANTKWCKKPEKWLRPWHMGTHLRVLSELSNEYQHDRVLIVFKNLWVIVLWMKLALALEGSTSITELKWFGTFSNSISIFGIISYLVPVPIPDFDDNYLDPMSVLFLCLPSPVTLCCIVFSVMALPHLPQRTEKTTYT